MITGIIEARNYDREARQIKSRTAVILTKWGLLPRFKHWRLIQDPDTSMIVLFGILNNNYIATHTSIPFSDYFDPRLLHDLSAELHVQVISCNSDGLRYAFILDRGQFDSLPTHLEYPSVDNGRLAVRVVYDGNLPVAPPAIINENSVIDDHIRLRRGVAAFLKVFDDIKLRDDAALLLSTQNLPDLMVIEEDEFKRRLAEHEANWQRSKHNRELFAGISGGDRT